jgi:hypothetical protein
MARARTWVMKRHFQKEEKDEKERVIGIAG